MIKSFKFISFIFILILLFPLISSQEELINRKDFSKVNDSELIRVNIKLNNENFRTTTYSHNELKRNLGKIKHEFENGVISTHVSKEKFEELQKNNELIIEKEEILHILLEESVPLINASYIHTLNTNNVSLKGQGQTICVIDSGVDYTHPDLGNCTEAEFLSGNCSKVIGGYDFCGDDSACISEDNNPLDVNGHGTHVAGIIAANGFIQGVAPESRLVALKVCNSSGDCFLPDIKAGINWCVNNASKYNISVISVSIGSGLYSEECDEYYDGDNIPEGSGSLDLVSSINNAISNNISVVFASGNDGSSTGISAPACIQNVTSVGATDKSDNVASYSNRNEILDLLAPGSTINSTYLLGYASGSGTSMAAPHVAGAIALLLNYKETQENSFSTPNQLLNALNNSGELIYDPSSNRNYSRINVYSALLEIDNKSPQINISYPEENQSINSLTIPLNFTISELNLNSSSCKYSINSGNNTSISNCENITFNVTSEGAYNLTLYASDLSNNSNSSTISFNVSLGPIISIESHENNSVIIPGEIINFTIEDENNISFANFSGTKNGSLINVSNNTWYINTSNWSTGEYNLTIISEDNLNNSENISYVFYLDYAPEIIFWEWYYNDTYTSNMSNISYENITGFENGSINFNISVNDSDYFSNLSYNWSIDSISFSNQSNWTYSPGLHDAGNYVLSLNISDSKLSTSKLWNLTIIDPWPPNFTLENKSLNEDTTLTYNISATDIDTDTLTYYDSSNNFDINSSTGLIRWTPSTPGVYEVMIAVYDGYNNVSKNFIITVNEVVEETFTPSGGGGGFVPLSSDSEEEEIENNVSYSLNSLSKNTIATNIENNPYINEILNSSINLKDSKSFDKLVNETKNVYETMKVDVSASNPSSKSTSLKYSFVNDYDDVLKDVKFLVEIPKSFEENAYNISISSNVPYSSKKIIEEDPVFLLVYDEINRSNISITFYINSYKKVSDVISNVSQPWIFFNTFEDTPIANASENNIVEEVPKPVENNDQIIEKVMIMFILNIILLLVVGYFIIKKLKK